MEKLSRAMLMQPRRNRNERVKIKFRTNEQIRTRIKKNII